jgi:uncharacterized protein YlxW (UPF0749 family)
MKSFVVVPMAAGMTSLVGDGMVIVLTADESSLSAFAERELIAPHAAPTFYTLL